jgi:hypothetical protein
MGVERCYANQFLEQDSLVRTSLAAGLRNLLQRYCVLLSKQLS